VKNITSTKKISAGRGRPRGFDTQGAVRTAMALFHARGYDAVGVAELGEAIGVKAPSLYAAFGSKKGLFERALALYVESEGGFIQAALAEEGSVAEVIGRLLTRAAEVYAAPGALPGCLVLDSTRNCSDPEVRRLTDRLRAEGRERLRRRIAQEFPETADVLADYVTVTLAGLSASARDGMAPAALRKAAEMAAEGFAAQLPDKA